MDDEEEERRLLELRSRIVTLQSEQARRREQMQAYDNRCRVVKDELDSRKKEVGELSMLLGFEAEKQSSAKHESHENQHMIEQQSAIKSSCTQLLSESIPGLKSKADQAASIMGKFMPRAGGGASPKAADKKEPFHDIVWVTYVRPQQGFNYQCTIKISVRTLVQDLHANVCDYWGCSMQETLLYKGSDDPRPLVQKRVPLNATILQQKDLETDLTQKEDLQSKLDNLTSRLTAPCTIGSNQLNPGDLFLGRQNPEEGMIWARTDEDPDENKRLPADILLWAGEEDELIFRFDNFRPVQDVLNLKDVAHVFLVELSEAGAWMERVKSGRRKLLPHEMAQKTMDKTAVRAAVYPTLIEGLKPWPGLFFEFTRHTDTRHWVEIKCRDIVAYLVLFLTSWSLLVSQSAPTAHLCGKSVDDLIFNGLGEKAVNTYGLSSYTKTTGNYRERRNLDESESEIDDMFADARSENLQGQELSDTVGFEQFEPGDTYDSNQAWKQNLRRAAAAPEANNGTEPIKIDLKIGRPARPLSSVKSIQEMWDWITYSLAEQLLNPTSTLSQHFIPYKQVLVRQQRVTRFECPRKVMVDSFKSSTISGVCYYHHVDNKDYIDKIYDAGSNTEFYAMQFPPHNTTYRTGDPLVFVDSADKYNYKMKTLDGTMVDGSGFALWYNTDFFRPDGYDAFKAYHQKKQFQKDMAFLEHIQWVDVQSRAVVVEFTLENPVLKCHAATSVVFAVHSSGGVEVQKDVQVADNKPLAEQNTFTGSVLRILCVLYLIGVKPYYQSYFRLNIERIAPTEIGCVNIMSVTDNLLAAAALLSIISRLNHVLPVEDALGRYQGGQMMGFSYFVQQIRLVEGMVILLATVQLARSCTLFARVHFLYKLVVETVIDFTMFSLMALPLFLGLVGLGIAIFGQHVAGYRNWNSLCIVLFSMTLGGIPSLDMMDTLSRPWTSVYLTICLFVGIFILWNGFAAIIVHNYNRLKLTLTGAGEKKWSIFRRFQNLKGEYSEHPGHEPFEVVTFDDALRFCLWTSVYKKLKSAGKKDSQGKAAAE